MRRLLASAHRLVEVVAVVPLPGRPKKLPRPLVATNDMAALWRCQTRPPLAPGGGFLSRGWWLPAPSPSGRGLGEGGVSARAQPSPALHATSPRGRGG